MYTTVDILQCTQNGWIKCKIWKKRSLASWEGATPKLYDQNHLSDKTWMCFCSEYRWSYHPKTGRRKIWKLLVLWVFRWGYPTSLSKGQKQRTTQTGTAKHPFVYKNTMLCLKFKRFKHIMLWHIYIYICKTKFWSHSCVTQVDCAWCILLCISYFLGNGAMPWKSFSGFLKIKTHGSLASATECWRLPSWELTYPLPRHFWRWFFSSPCGIC